MGGREEAEEEEAVGSEGIHVSGNNPQGALVPLPSICFPNGANYKAELRFNPCSNRLCGEGAAIPPGSKGSRGTGAPLHDSSGIAQEPSEHPQPAPPPGLLAGGGRQAQASPSHGIFSSYRGAAWHNGPTDAGSLPLPPASAQCRGELLPASSG